MRVSCYRWPAEQVEQVEQRQPDRVPATTEGARWGPATARPAPTVSEDQLSGTVRPSVVNSPSSFLPRQKPRHSYGLSKLGRYCVT